MESVLKVFKEKIQCVVGEVVGMSGKNKKKTNMHGKQMKLEKQLWKKEAYMYVDSSAEVKGRRRRDYIKCKVNVKRVIEDNKRKVDKDFVKS